MAETVLVGGPWFEDISVGDHFDDVPGVTLNDAHTTLYQAMFGDRQRLPLDHHLATQVTGRPGLINNSLVGNVAIGLSTIPSQRVLGNLFYRNLMFLAPVYVGDTLYATTEVLAVKQNTIRPGRAASGVVVLQIEICNQNDDRVMSFARCPMIPCRDPDADTGRNEPIDSTTKRLQIADVADVVPAWDLAPLRSRTARASGLAAGTVFELESRDTVTLAPELVRLTLNMAMTHTDAHRSVYARRLVYGGHTISMAAAQLSRIFPSLVAIFGWHRCDHTGPVFEGDVLATTVLVSHCQSQPDGSVLVELHATVQATRADESPDPGTDVKVLDWELVALIA